MKKTQNFGRVFKVTAILTLGVLLTSCGSVGGFNDMLGIKSEGIDASNAEKNALLKNANGTNLPVPEGAELNTVVSIEKPVAVNNSSKIIAPKIIAPKIKAPKIVKPTIVATKPKPKPTVKVKPKTPTKTKPVGLIKVSPVAYKFVDLFSFRADMRAGKLSNPLATASLIAKKNSKCSLKGRKFTCGEYFITIQ